MPTNNEQIIMPNLGNMFNLDCFHFNEIKNTIKKIFEHLMSFDNRMDQFEERLRHVPDFSKLMLKLKYLEDKIPIIDKKCDETKYFAEGTKATMETLISKERVRGDGFDKRIKELQTEIELLKRRPSGVDYKDFY